MTTIDVHDLPEPLARAVAETVRHLREQLQKKTTNDLGALPEWNLGARGRVARDEIYDYLDECGPPDAS